MSPCALRVLLFFPAFFEHNAYARLSQAVKEPVKAIHLECCVTGVYIIIIIMQQLPLFAGSGLSLSSTDVFETYPIHSLFKAISLKINCGTGSRGQQRFFCYMISLGRSACLPACSISATLVCNVFLVAAATFLLSKR